MKIGLVGPSNQEKMLPFDAQRSINLYPVVDDSEGGKENAALYGTPGLSAFATIPDSPIRGVFASAKGRAFVVAGVGLYEVTSGATVTLRGTLTSNESICTIAENVTQLAVCDGADLWILTYSTNVFAKVTDADFPTASSVAFQDQLFIVNKPSTAEVYISAVADGYSWAALDFQTAESSPDNLVRVFSAFGQIWCFGETTTEVWYNSGDTTYPFTRVEGAKIQIGLAAKHSVVEMDNRIFWIGNDKDGKGIVYAAQGYTPVRISTHAIELLLRSATDLSAVRSYTYQEDGHIFYAITGGGMTTSLFYDAATGLWHERAYLEADGSLSAHRAVAHMYIFGKHLVADKTSGVIYEMSNSYYSDNGDEIFRQRTFTHLHDENKRFVVRELQVDFEAGLGLTSGQGSNPVALLETSNDGGKTWSSQYTARIGALGNYKARAVWRRLGQFDLFTARITVTDPIRVAICGAYLS